MKPTLFGLLLTAFGLLLTACSVLSSTIWADDHPADDASRGVARISFLNGDVSVRRGDSGEIVASSSTSDLRRFGAQLTHYERAPLFRVGFNTSAQD